MYSHAARALTNAGATITADVTSATANLSGNALNKVGAGIEGTGDNAAARMVGGVFREAGAVTTENGGATANLMLEVGDGATRTTMYDPLSVGRGISAGAQGLGGAVARRPTQYLKGIGNAMAGSIDAAGEAVGAGQLGSRMKSFGYAPRPRNPNLRPRARPARVPAASCSLAC